MKIVLLANTAWYLYNHRISLARRLRELGIQLVLLSPEDEYASKLLAEGFDWKPVEMSRQGINPIVELGLINSLYRIYRQIEPDAVHHFTAKPVLYGSLAARLAGVPTIINSITGLGYLFLRRGRWGSLLRRMAGAFYRFSQHSSNIKVIFQNQSDMELFTDSGWVSPDQTVLIPGSGVDVDRFQPEPEPPGTPIVLMVGRMLWDKGVGEFVEAARLLSQKHVRAHFHLVGETDLGNPAAIPEARLRQWAEEGIIRWLGRLDNMPEVYAGSTIVVLPSYREGLSLSLIEAAAAGRPLIATDIPGCREVVRDGINGLLVPLQDSEKLAEAIERLLADRDLRQQMGQAGRQIAVSEYSNQRIDAATLALYPLG